MAISWQTWFSCKLFSVLLSWRKVLVLKDPRGPIFKSLFLSLSSSSSSGVQASEIFEDWVGYLCQHFVLGYDVTSVWLVLRQVCISGRRGRLFETRCLQCCCSRGKSLSSRTNFQVLVLVLVLVLKAWPLVLVLVLESQVLDNNTCCFIPRIRLSSPPQKTNEDRRTHSHNQRRKWRRMNVVSKV